jgi:hypothetical protein
LLRPDAGRQGQRQQQGDGAVGAWHRSGGDLKFTFGVPTPPSCMAEQAAWTDTA